MRLSDLEARFVRCGEEEDLHTVLTLGEAQGVLFLCPKCYAANCGPIGTHSVLVWFRDHGVPAAARPTARWGVAGTSLGDLTLTPSIHLTGEGCGWHGFVTGSDVT